MFAIRPQVAFVCASAALATLLILRLRAPFPSPAIKLCFRLSAAAVSVSALVLFVFYGSIGGDSVEGLLPKLSAVVHGLSFGGTAIDIPIFSTWTDLIAYLPYGAIVVLFRPFPWEEGNTFIRLAGIHQLLLTSSFLLIAWGMIKRFKVGRALGSKAAKLASLDPLTVFLLAYCLAFVFLYAVISGNVGTLVREKIQVAPFAWCAAFALNSFLRVPLRWPRRVNQLAMGGAIHEF
jgi:hypothetical protein